MTEISLTNLVRYCKDYLKLINPARSRINLKTEFIDKNILDTNKLLTTEIDSEEDTYLLNFAKFYEADINDYESLSEEDLKQYEYEKQIINQLDAIKAKSDTDQYTKYIQLNFGFLDLKAKHILDDIEEVSEDSENTDEHYQFAVFSIPVSVSVIRGKYYLTLLDTRLTPNFSLLSKILEEDQYYSFLEEMNTLEADESFSLPVKMDTMHEVYIELVSNLKKTEGVIFQGEPLDLEHVTISLSSKSNYFLIQDLEAIEKDIPDEELLETSLSGWLTAEGLDEDENLDSSEGQLLFPFQSDKYQRGVLGVINNRVSIVQGPPGTGKSQTIANIVCHLAAKGKTVLFVSQKDQAIKVVKDNLKQLNIPGLFGYIPNRYSSSFTKIDETDGAANELSRLKTNLNKDMTKAVPTFEDIDIIDASLKHYLESLDIERKYFEVSEQLNDLEDFIIEVSNPENFEKINLSEFIENLREQVKTIANIKHRLVELEDIKITSSISKILDGVDIKNYPNASERVTYLSKELREHIKDRGGFNSLRKLRNKALLSKLTKISDDIPKKAVVLIEELISKDLDKDDIDSEMITIAAYFESRELKQKLEELNLKLDKYKNTSGLDSAEITRLIILAKTHGSNTFSKVSKAYELNKELQLLKTQDINLANSVIHKARTRHQDQVRQVLNNIIRSRAEEALSHQPIRSIIEQVSRVFAKSKRAYKTFDKLKERPEFFDTVQSIFPVWMMSLEDVSRVIPLKLNMFDYVIVDESSQCNIGYALPSMVRGQHSIFFGDTLQMRDDTIKFKSNIILQQLAKKHQIPEHLQIKSANDSVKSVMDIGVLRGYKQKTLRIHYRSPRELIGFSNQWFYKPLNRSLEIANSTFLAYKDTNRCLINHVIKSDRDKELSLKTNTDEADYIVNLVNEIKNSTDYKGESIGVLTFFNDQATLIREKIDDEEIKVSNIEGIQGDERDIIIYSFVINDPSEKRRYIALTGEGGQINKELNEGRVNVAFSRAKKQVHCVTSLSREQWPEGIWIRRYLDYVQDNGKLNRLISDGVDKDRFDSFFEEDLYNRLNIHLDEDYVLQNQVESCGFKIDFVLMNRKTGQRLAIECDGPTHFENESDDIVVANDWERQSILESAGWKFYRIPYSKWTDDKSKAQVVEDIIGQTNIAKAEDNLDYKSFLKIIGAKQIGAGKDEEYESTTPKDSVLTDFITIASSDNKDETAVSNDSPPSTYPTDTKSDFDTIDRIKLANNSWIIFSKYDNGSKIALTEYVNGNSYTGFTKKNISIDSPTLMELINALSNTIKDKNERYIAWTGNPKSKKVVISIQNEKVDIRQWITTPTYEGYTKKGFRLSYATTNELISALNSYTEKFLK